MREHLLAWQWSDYAAKHQDRGNLLLHIVAVPLFQLSTLVLLSGAVTGALATAGLGALGVLVSIVAQGRGHRRERESPTPFAGAGDVLTRLVAEQWVTFPRFVVSGRWYRNLRGGTNPGRRP